MNGPNSTDADRVCSNIESFLSELSKVVGPSGFPARKLIMHGGTTGKEVRASGYIYRNDPLLGKEERILLVIPRSKSMTPEDAFSYWQATLKDTNSQHMYFIDCYGTSQKRPERTTVLTPDELWRQFFGGPLRPFASSYKRKHAELLHAVGSDYRSRVLLFSLPHDTEHDTVSDLRPLEGSSEQVLLSWALRKNESLRDRLLIFGESGLGKTWSLLHFALQLSESGESVNPWVNPKALYIDLSQVKDELLMGTGLDSLLSKYISLGGYAPLPKGGVSVIEALIRSGLVILLLDEFDAITRQFDENVVEHHYKLILQSLPPNARLIVATRSTRFSSRARMLATFASGGHDSDDRISRAEPELEQRGVVHFSTATLAMFSDFASFLSEASHGTANTDSDDEQRLATVVDTDPRLNEIGKIPRYAQAALGVYEIMRASGLEKPDPMRVLELAVIWQLRFNLITGRAVYNLYYRDSDGTQLERLDIHKRLRILERIAWFLVEFKRNEIDSEEMKHAMLEYAPGYIKEAINDLKCQTVFEFSDGDSSKLKFRQTVLKVFFAARSICSLLWRDPEETEPGRVNLRRGIRNLGLFQLALIDEGYGMLQTFFNVGFLHVPPDDSNNGYMEAPEESGYWKDNVKTLDFDDILKQVMFVLMEERAFSNNTCFLLENLNVCGVDTSKHRDYDEWSRIVSDEREKEGRERLRQLCSSGILVHGEQIYEKGTVTISPFLIAKQEVVNKEFKEFLGYEAADISSASKIPRLAELDTDAERFVSEANGIWRRVCFCDRDEDSIHALAWEVIHRSAESGGKDNAWTRRLTNDYHLFDWIMGEVPDNGEEQPVVWISYYVAALYCNWRSEKEGLDPAYMILVRTDATRGTTHGPSSPESAVRVFLNPLADGFRLPFAGEWALAARADRNPDDFPWTGEAGPVQKRLKEALTSSQAAVLPVTRSYCNGFGVYGMVGNVREWAEDQSLYDQYCRERHESVEHKNEGGSIDIPWLEVRDSGRIMGSTWALGEATFRYAHEGPSTGMVLPRCNTNPDVGFRWARSPLPIDAQFIVREESKKQRLRQELTEGGIL